MEDSYIVQGGIPLKGTVQLSGAKNIALKIIIAALLFDEPVVLNNIPHIRDIEELMNLIHVLGGKAEFTDKNQVTIDGTAVSSHSIDLLYASKVRVSFMFFAPLLRKFKKAVVPNPGGCRLGARDIDRPVQILKNMGVEIKYTSDDGFYHAELLEDRFQGTEYTFEKPSHTGTELAIMVASLAKGSTTIKNVSLEPEIDDLIRFLNNAGANIVKKDRTIHVEGVERLHVKEPYTIENDRNEAVTYGCLALATKGDIIIKGISLEQIQIFLDHVKQIGGGIEEIDETSFRIFYKEELSASDITVIPHPGFMTDWQGPWAVLMTQANGTSTIHETIYENRFAYVEELEKLGAQIEFFQPEVDNPAATYQFNWTKEHSSPQAIRIFGKTILHNGVMNVADLRAGATLLIAGAVAKGMSIINGASHIERGYENIEHKIQLLGGNIKKV